MSGRKIKETYEEALTELESIVKRLESGDAGLDESLGLFEKGMGLLKICETRLTEAQSRVDKIIEEGGTLLREPLEGGDEDEETQDED